MGKVSEAERSAPSLTDGLVTANYNELRKSIS